MSDDELTRVEFAIVLTVIGISFLITFGVALWVHSLATGWDQVMVPYGMGFLWMYFIDNIVREYGAREVADE